MIGKRKEKAMKKLLFVGVLGWISLGVAFETGRTSQGLSELQQLGITAGVAQACGVGEKLKNFELIANRIIANPTATVEEEKKQLKEFAAYKLAAYNEQKRQPALSCQEVVRRFNDLPIFQSIIYADGTIKLPDGRIIKPNRPLKKAKEKK